MPAAEPSGSLCVWGKMGACLRKIEYALADIPKKG